MSARSVPSQPTNRAPDFVSDDRGAIMVMGIFMCTLLVGALWYIAGIGDALFFHERMQEAADSVAFSTAIIEARGMNIIVLINLIMAAILAIRVAINMIKLALTVLAAVFAAIALIPFCEWAAVPAEACEDGAQIMQDADDATTEPINAALEALCVAWQGIEYATPAGAIAGALEMQNYYAPPVQVLPIPPLGSVTTTGWGLPVTADSTTKLCKKAAEGVGDLLGDLLPAGVGGVIGGALSALAGADPSYFCELPGGSSTPPDISGAGCSAGNSAVCDSANDAGTYYNNLVAQDASPAAIASAQSTMDSLNNSCQNSNSSAQQNCNSAAQSANSSASNNSSSSSGSMNPAMVTSSWYNGTDDAQTISFLASDGNGAVNVSPRLVNVAQTFNSPGHAKVTMSGPELVKGQLNSWAQAEFFYDNPGSWDGSKDDAMWNFYWRARFRLTNPGAVPGGTVIDVLNAPYSAAIASDIGTSFGKFNLLNIMTKANLLSAVASEKLALH